MSTNANVTTNPITAVVSNGNVTATVSSATITASASGGIGPAGPQGTTGSSGASDYTQLTNKPSTFPPSSHTHTAAQITDFSSAVAAAAPPTTDASALTSGTLSASRLPASVVLTTDSRLSDSRTPTTHQHAVSDVTGLQAALDGKQATGSYAAASHTHAAADVSGLALVATSGAYADLTGKPTIPAATTSASDLISGTLADARLSANVVLTSDARLSDSRAPTSHAASHAAAGSDPLTISSTQVTGLPTAGAGAANYCAGNDARLSDARTPTSHVHAASDISSGTLADARLSSNVVLAATLAGRQHQTTAVVDAVDRNFLTTNVAPVSGAIYWTFFTPAVSTTITQISYASFAAASGVTLCRFGLYAVDGSGNVTLVARTASDTTIFNAANSIFTRSLDATGGYPTSYSLAAGTRYAVAMCLVASGMGSMSGSSCPAVLGALSPRVQGVRTGAGDLLTSSTSGQFNGSVGHIYWARLS